MSHSLIVLKTFADEASAHIAHAVLESNGITSVVSADNSGHMQPYLQYALGIRLLVDSSDADAALELLGAE